MAVQIPVQKLNLWAIQKTHHQIMRNVPDVKYGLGSKVNFKQPSFHPSQVRVIDCSGLAGLLVYYGCEKRNLNPVFPDGSWNQRDWLKKQSLLPGSIIHQVSSYSKIEADPSALYICTLDPIYNGNKLIKSGHVWFVNDGFTMESHGGTGPAERVWNTPILKSEVDYVFKWEHTWKEIPNLL